MNNIKPSGLPLGASRLIQAAVIDAGLITAGTLCAMFSLYLLSLFGESAHISEARVTLAVSVLLPPLAPLLYRLSCQTGGLQSSLGESCLKITLGTACPAPNAARIWNIIRNLLIGFLPVITGLLVVLTNESLFRTHVTHGEFAFGPARLFAFFSIAPILYCLSLTLLLAAVNIYDAKRAERAYGAEAVPLSPIVVEHAIRTHVLYFLIAPCFVAGQIAFGFPDYSRVLFQSTDWMVLLAVLLFWMIWAVPLIRYGSKGWYPLVYSSVFLVPFLASQFLWHEAITPQKASPAWGNSQLYDALPESTSYYSPFFSPDCRSK